MKSIIAGIIFFNFITLQVYSQKKGDWLRQKFKNADTVLLVSHDLVKGSTDMQVDSLHNIIQYPSLLFKHRPNTVVIKEQVIVQADKLDELVKILAKQYPDSAVSQGCLLTHHAIFLIKNGQASFINLSFECGSYETSDNLKHLEPFDKKKWDDLEKYFRNLGIKYYFDSH